LKLQRWPYIVWAIVVIDDDKMLMYMHR